MFKSYSDLKSSLDISRERKALCRTSVKELEILKELEDRRGKFTDNNFKRATIQREKSRKFRQTQFLDRARMQLFINKARRSSLQDERLKPVEHTGTSETKSTQTNLPSEGASKFRRIELKY